MKNARLVVLTGMAVFATVLAVGCKQGKNTDSTLLPQKPISSNPTPVSNQSNAPVESQKINTTLAAEEPQKNSFKGHFYLHLPASHNFFEIVWMFHDLDTCSSYSVGSLGRFGRIEAGRKTFYVVQGSATGKKLNASSVHPADKAESERLRARLAKCAKPEGEIESN